ncbi:DUF58 domain-containing protein [Calothrix sp. UHCC 0171]|uniref:DUF58 domain-containing protein n=1 Tax=Calothrix sp. UHCC 0171 TaxID=3110245 RepID=UPI002B1EFB02|nr:DUF58 domain-containing protein [Calothrix sp. UHCC 0171]MEA5569680.1 DUF58 domain-containing protein [Calothrix sp. UHCC 0171]
MIKRITNYLETRACVPAYSGWVLGGIAICFFGAAINTMAGWLYVSSGLSCAILAVAAILPPRSLSRLRVSRRLIEPVTAGEDLRIQLEVTNQSHQNVSLLKIADVLPLVLKDKFAQQPIEHTINHIDPKNSYEWEYYYPTQRRGIYRWQTVQLISGAPLGLFWSRRDRNCPATAIVYPQILPLVSCPLIDELGKDESCKNNYQGNPAYAATEGLIRSLRPYRTGDPIRLVHWRTSARYGELRVRELEVITGGEDIIIALDSAAQWDEENFEQAVIATTSLYFYAQRQQMNVQLWTAGTGLVRGENRRILETLAATLPQEDAISTEPPKIPLIWLTENAATIASLPNGSRWALWQNQESEPRQIINKDIPGLIISKEEQLQSQLQKTI